MKSSLVLGILASFVHWIYFSLGEHLLALFSLSSNFINSLECWVQVASTDQITGIEGINISVSFEIINIKCKLNCINFLLLKTKFLKL